MQHHVPLTGFDVTVESLLCKDLQLFWLPSTPKGIRTPVHGLRIRCPRPLDDGSLRSGQHSRAMPELSTRSVADSEAEATEAPTKAASGAFPGKITAQQAQEHRIRTSPEPTTSVRNITRTMLCIRGRPLPRPIHPHPDIL